MKRTFNTVFENHQKIPHFSSRVGPIVKLNLSRVGLIFKLNVRGFVIKVETFLVVLTHCTFTLNLRKEGQSKKKEIRK